MAGKGGKAPDGFTPSTLGRNQEGNPSEFFAKLTGYGYNDMIALPTLTKDSILDNLSRRFKYEVVYTYVGDIVISVNPFKNVGNVAKGIRAKYKGASRSGLPPHIYALVDHSYNEMMRNFHSQSILISGESGAGKTEAMKICLTYIGEVSATKGKRVSDEVSVRLMQTNPVMEAMGNAKTVRNNNSSRFGKHFDIQFSENGIILGALTSSYLLEKPRITIHLEGERNYHVFYMLCKAPAPVRTPINLSKWQDYKICNQKGTVAEVTTWNDQSEFADMHEALLKLGFSEEHRLEMYQMLSFVLHLGNVDFKPGKEGSDIKEPKSLEMPAQLMRVTPKQLQDAICFRTMGGGKLSTYKVPLEPRAATAMRNSLCMHVYSLVFDWCVAVINEYISVFNAAYCVGILDIFGFENFSINSFPQLCINFTNESLHNLFIEHVFKLEQEVYVKEEVEWNFVSYEDNQPTLDLIVKRPICILGLLDEGCKTGSGKDSSVLENFHSTFTQPKYAKGGYIKPKKSSDRTFVLSHYAGEVVYSIEGWVEKNKDELSPDVTALLEVHTEFEKLKELAQLDTQKKADEAEAKAKPGRRGGGGGSAKKTVAKTFSESLAALMEKLRATEHHYIRCLKPNQTLKAGDWDNDFMFKQLAYSGTLEVTQIRKAGLNVRRPLKHFYMYYKICADDPAALRAGTVTKRTELLLKQLGVDENKYRVGKTLLFLLNYDIIDRLDEVRKHKIVEYVVTLQSFFRMFGDYRKYRAAIRAIGRVQGFCKSWEIRRAYTEVRAASRLLARWGRVYLAVSKLRDMMGTEDETLTPEKKRETLLKILYPEKHGRGRLGISGKRRVKLQPVRVAGAADDEDAEYLEMPKFQIAHEGWLSTKLGVLRGWEKKFLSLKQGTLTMYTSHEATDAVLSFNMAVCKLTKEEDKLTIVRTEKLYMHKVRSFREYYRRVKGPLWGNDCLIVQRDEENKEMIDTWADKVEESIAEAKMVDSYKMQVNIDGDEADDRPVNQKVASIIKEGYLRKKKPGNSAVQDMKRSWERRYFVLYNDGKMRYYDSRAKTDEKGSLDLRFFALKEIDEDLEVDEEDGGDEKQSLKVQGQFFKIMKGKQFALHSGRHTFYMASPEREVCDEWISTLNTTLSILYQKSPLFSQEFLRIYLMDNTFTTMPLTEFTKARDVIRFMCKKHVLNNETEWGLHEQWDHPGINGTMTERKLPGDELLLDVTMLAWERAARKRFGIVSVVPQNAFKLCMKKVTSLLPQARTKKEQSLEFCQALSDLKEGRFTSPDSSEIFDLAALAIFRDLKDGMTEAEQEEELVLEEGQLTTQLNFYLPKHWFRAAETKRAAVREQQLEEWDRKVVLAFNDLTRAEIAENENMSEVRRIVQSFRMETDLNSIAATRMYIERVRIAPLCFSAQYIAEMWSVDKILKVLVVINAGGFHVHRLGASPMLIKTFDFDTLVSWQSMHDMLIINIIYQTSKMEATKRREKLRFLTRESVHMRTLLSKYAEVVLANLMKRMREREALQRAREEDDDDDDI